MTNRTFLVVALSLLAAITAPCYLASWSLTFVPARSGDPNIAKVQLWFLLVAVQGAVWVICAAFLISAFHEAWNRHLGPKRWILLRALVPTVLLAGALYVYFKAAGSDLRPAQLGGITLNHGLSFSVFGVAIAMCSVTGMFFVHCAMLAHTRSNPPGDLPTYMSFKSQLQIFLSIAAVILSLGILGTAAMRLAVNAEKGGEYFPAEYVVIYGAIFSLLLLIAYVPVKMSFWRVGVELVREIMGTPPGAPAELVEWFENKGKLEKVLDLDMASISAFIGPVAALLPLLSGWISILLGSNAKQ